MPELYGDGSVFNSSASQPVDVYALNDSIVYVAVGGNDIDAPKAVVVYDLNQKKVIESLPKAWNHRAFSVAMQQDRSILVAVPLDGKVYKISTDKIVSVFAGGGSQNNNADGVPATSLVLKQPSNARVCPDGQVLIADEQGFRIWRIDLDGRAYLYAGNDSSTVSGDGGLAIHAGVPGPRGIWCDRNLTTYIAQGPNTDRNYDYDKYHYIRSVDQNGIINTIAGVGKYDSTTFPTPTLEAGIRNPNSPVVGKDRYVYFLDRNNYQICRIRPLFEWKKDSPQTIADPSGRSLYLFRQDGRHLRTLDARTRAVLRSFVYDTTGALLAEVGAGGDTLWLQRSSNGIDLHLPGRGTSAIHLGLDVKGWLSDITPANGKKSSILHSPNGLLQSFIDKNGNAALFEYDNEGRFSGKLLPDLTKSILEVERSQDTSTWDYQSQEGRSFKSVVIDESDVSGRKIQVRRLSDSAGLISETKLSLPSVRVTKNPSGVLDSVHTKQDPHLLSLVRYPDYRKVSVSGAGYEMIDSSSRASYQNGLAKLDSTSENRYHRSIKPFGSLWKNGASNALGFNTPSGRMSSFVMDSSMRIFNDYTIGVVPTSLTYGSMGKIDSVSSAGRSISVNHSPNDGGLMTVKDPVDREIQIAPDSTGAYQGRIRISSALSVPLLGQCPTWNGYRVAYDRDGLLQWGARSEGDTAWFKRDPVGRLIGVQVGNWSSWSHYDTTRRLDAITTSEGQVLGMAWLGNWNVLQTWKGVTQGFVSRTLDKSGNIDTIQIDTALRLVYTRDLDGLPTKIQVGNEWVWLTRGASGFLISDSTEHMATTHSYNPHGELSSDTLYSRISGSRALVWSVTQSYDSLGRVISNSQNMSGNFSASIFHYNVQGRVDSIFQNGSLHSFMIWDSLGERVSGTVGGQSFVRTSSATGMVINQGGRLWSWGPGGRLRWSVTQGAKDTTKYQVDVLGRLVGASLPNGSKVQFILDGLGRRVAKKLDGVLKEAYLYDGMDRLVTVSDSSGRLKVEYVYASRANVPDWLRFKGRLHRVVTDPQGNVRAVIDAGNGYVVQKISYDPYGFPSYLIGNAEIQPLGALGGLWESLTNSVHLSTGDYLPSVSEWVDRSRGSFPSGDINLRIRSSRGTEVTPWSF